MNAADRRRVIAGSQLRPELSPDRPDGASEMDGEAELIRMYGEDWMEKNYVSISSEKLFPGIEAGWMICTLCHKQLAGFWTCHSHFEGKQHRKYMEWLKSEQCRASGLPMLTAGPLLSTATPTATQTPTPRSESSASAPLPQRRYFGFDGPSSPSGPDQAPWPSAGVAPHLQPQLQPHQVAQAPWLSASAAPPLQPQHAAQAPWLSAAAAPPLQPQHAAQAPWLSAAAAPPLQPQHTAQASSASLGTLPWNSQTPAAAPGHEVADARGDDVPPPPPPPPPPRTEQQQPQVAAPQAAPCPGTYGDMGSSIAASVSAAPPRDVGNKRANVDYDGIEIGAAGSVEAGYMAVARGDLVEVLCERAPGHSGNRYDYYVYGRSLGNNSVIKQGWLPDEILV